MANTQAYDLRIKRLTHMESEYRGEIKRATQDMKVDPDRKARYERIIRKYERKIEKLLPKIRRLREVRARLRA